MKPVIELLNDLSEELSTLATNCDLVIENGEVELTKEFNRLVDMVSNIRLAITGDRM